MIPYETVRLQCFHTNFRTVPTINNNKRLIISVTFHLNRKGKIFFATPLSPFNKVGTFVFTA